MVGVLNEAEKNERTPPPKSSPNDIAYQQMKVNHLDQIQISHKIRPI